MKLTLIDLDEKKVIYDIDDGKGTIEVNLDTDEKIVNTENLTEDVINKAYKKILWYKKLDNFFEHGII